MSARFESSDAIRSWGRVVRASHRVAQPRFRDELPDALREMAADGVQGLAVGLRRSYGDSCLNPDGALVAMAGLARVHFFDAASGIIRADAGLSISDLIALVLPRGFFPPVVPGTRYVTIGGAVANDVHGKNHHHAGTFGCHVRALKLRRTDGSVEELNAASGSPLFAATVGGLGLTGVIEWVELALRRIPGSDLRVETIAFHALDEFFALAEHHRQDEYTVAWIDCTNSGRSLGRGIFSRADHAESSIKGTHGAKPKRKIPLDFPNGALNAWTLKAFNAAYFALSRARAGSSLIAYDRFFFPLDAIADWNRLYGAAGMYQYQCVIPASTSRAATQALLQQIAASGEGSFLAVLKTFGSVASPGLLSFPRPGTTLALDFRNRGAATLKLFGRLDAIVREAGGRLYAAKDGRIPAAMFQSGYPRLTEFSHYVDPGLSSAFWRRVRP